MDLADLAKSGMLEDLDDAELIDEKPIKGAEGAVLRKIRSSQAGLVNNVRLCLSKQGLKTSAVFGGEVAGFISPKDYDRYYELIESEEEFYTLSEKTRQQLIDVLKA